MYKGKETTNIRSIILPKSQTGDIIVKYKKTSLKFYSVTIDFMALLLHETIPGHHLQVSGL